MQKEYPEVQNTVLTHETARCTIHDDANRKHMQIAVSANVLSTFSHFVAQGCRMKSLVKSNEQ